MRWSPRRGLGAKTRLSSLVLNFLPSAYGGLPSRVVGLAATAGLGEPEAWQSCLCPATGRSLLTSLRPPASSSRHLLTLLGWEQPPAPAPGRRRPPPRAVPAPSPASTAAPSPWAREGARGRRMQAAAGGGEVSVPQRVRSPRTHHRHGVPKSWAGAEGPLHSFPSLMFRKASSAPSPLLSVFSLSFFFLFYILISLKGLSRSQWSRLLL